MAKLVIITVPYWLGEKTAYSGSVEAALEAGIAEQIGTQTKNLLFRLIGRWRRPSATTLMPYP